ncbi:MAG: hypothetical protein FAF05_04235 [Epsilonproteobacteria bacterium]|nr:hypothetical protein [Campylobacterota bacterium]
MKILLRKVTKSPSDFEILSEDITFKGYLEYHSPKLTRLHAKLQGDVAKPCDICAEDMSVSVDEEVEFFISDGIYQQDDTPLEFDVVESFDENADIDALMQSEVEMIKSDYHTCENCKDKDEFEF